MNRVDTDVCVIGAGSGGLSVAAGAVQMGARVVLLEGGRMGGDCLNYGCVPSKALIAAASIAGTGYAAAMEHVARTIETIAPVDSQERFEGLGVRVIREYGRFISETEVQAGENIIRARRFVIATGSSPFIPVISGLEEVPYLTNETLFDLRERPEHLLIIGGGPIGMEMAQAHRRLGARVTVLEADRALGREDPELAAIVLDRLRAEGIEIVENARIARVSGGEGQVSVEMEGGEAHAGSHLLVAAGRKVNLDRLDLPKARIAHTRAVTVGPDLRSISNRRVYAVGDAASGAMFTHVAGYHAGVVIRSILFGLPSKARTDHLPAAVYTDPELAQVGLNEAQARAKFGGNVEILTVPYEENDRAIATGAVNGRLKVIVAHGRPVGAAMVGKNAGDLIGTWSLAISAKLKMSALAGMVLPYPTLGEINKRAAGAYFSPRLFDSGMVKRAVRFVQRWIP